MKVEGGTELNLCAQMMTVHSDGACDEPTPTELSAERGGRGWWGEVNRKSANGDG